MMVRGTFQWLCQAKPRPFEQFSRWVSMLRSLALWGLCCLGIMIIFE